MNLLFLLLLFTSSSTFAWDFDKTKEYHISEPVLNKDNKTITFELIVFRNTSHDDWLKQFDFMLNNDTILSIINEKHFIELYNGGDYDSTINLGLPNSETVHNLSDIFKIDKKGHNIGINVKRKDNLETTVIDSNVYSFEFEIELNNPERFLQTYAYDLAVYFADNSFSTKSWKCAIRSH